MVETIITTATIETTEVIETPMTKDTAKPIIIGTVMGILTLILLTIIIALLVIFMRCKIKDK